MASCLLTIYTFVPNVDSTYVVSESSTDPVHDVLNTPCIRGDFSSPLYDPAYNSLASFVLNHIDPSIASGPSFADIDTIHEFEESLSAMPHNAKFTRHHPPPD